MADPFDWLTALDWLSPLLHLAQNAAGRVTLEVTAWEADQLERVGVRCGAPILDHATGTYIVTVRRSDLPKATRLLVRLRALG